MGLENSIPVSAGIGGGFFGGLLLGYALKKVIKLIAIIVGLFIMGLAYLHYQRIVSVNWGKVESTFMGLFNTTTNTFTDYNIETLTANKPGHSPCWWYVSRFCDWLHETMVKLNRDNVLTRNIRTIQSSSNEGMLRKERIGSNESL
jgi:uncharacterized membrane protein (Fun14 family)